MQVGHAYDLTGRVLAAVAVTELLLLTDDPAEPTEEMDEARC